MRVLLVCLTLIAVASSGCKSDKTTSEREAIRAVAPKTAECAACSMVVREQPSPRGQLVHRDGTRKFFCALADMMQYLRAPSAHGKPKAIFVEVNDPAARSPKEISKTSRPWIAAAAAHYVVGVERRGVMGTPALAYAAKNDAARVAKRYKAKVVAWSRLELALLGEKK